MKVKTTVSPKVLDLYNEIVEAEQEDTRLITADYVGDVVEGIMRDTAYGECGNEDEYTVDTYFLKTELHTLLCDAYPSMCEEDMYIGMISRSGYYAKRKRWKSLYEKFVKVADATPAVAPWLITEI